MNKLKKIQSLLFLLPFFTQTFDYYPLKIEVHNKSAKNLTISIEYQLDQYYKNNQNHTSFIPNNNKFFPLQEIKPAKYATFNVFAYDPCPKKFNAVLSNLLKENFKPDHKMIQGSITIKEYRRSYDFKFPVCDDSVIIITFKRHKKPKITVIKKKIT